MSAMAHDPTSPADVRPHTRNEPSNVSLSDEDNYVDALVAEGVPKAYAAEYAAALIKHCIGPRSRVVLDQSHLKEMGVRIGHRDELLSAVRKLRSQLAEPQGSFVASPGLPVHTVSESERKPDDPDAPFMIQDVAPPKGAERTPETELRCHRWRFDNGTVWDDWNGWVPGDEVVARDSFTTTMTEELRRFDISNIRSFLSLFADNKPMPFLSTEGNVSGLLLRLPSPDLLVGDEQMEISSVSTTVHELMNRLVILIGQDREGRPTILSYRKDRTVGWMGYFSREWERLRQMSVESIICRILRESIESFRPVLQTLSRQLELVSNLPDSYRPVYVVKTFSRIQRQASVLARCLAGNVKVAGELRDSNPLLADLTAAINVADTLHSFAEEIEENAQEMMGLRLTMMDFKAQTSMKLFTYFSCIASPIGVITGWFGMNFDQMEELHIDGFYYGVVGFVLGFIVLIVGFLAWVNRDRSVTRENERLAALVLMEDALDATD